jgi:hypothetical protein
MVIKHLLVSDHSEYEMPKKNTAPTQSFPKMKEYTGKPSILLLHPDSGGYLDGLCTKHIFKD